MGDSLGTTVRIGAIESLVADATEVLFFTGKGGVGKTSIACAVAVALADAGKRVLVVSTDPASNLDHVLETPLSETPRAIPGVDGLFASNLDPERAAATYREVLIGPYRGVLPPATVASMEEQLSGACTVEIAAFNEFAKLVGDDLTTAEYDVVIFDTAPTGHTLRLLTLPTAWTDFIDTNTTGNSCLGPLAGLQEQRALYARTVKALSSPELTTLILVSRPDASSLAEAARSSAELAELGISNQRLVLNGIFSASDPEDPTARALERRGRDALASLPAAIASLPALHVPFVVRPPLGVEGLRYLSRVEPGVQPASDAPGVSAGHVFGGSHSLAGLVDEIAARGSGVVMTMGKGGVGKTTIASAIALELAGRGLPVHLSTTDPAAHVAEVVADMAGALTVSRIDPEAEVAAYREQVLNKARPQLDSEALALLDEDLRSPCTEEIAIFHAFARVVAEAADRFVVLDTAPTGHTLLLIDSSEAYHREVTRNATDTPPQVLELLPRLRDPDFTKVIIVTLAEATPVSEAQRLQDDLARAGIAPYAWVVNQTFAGIDTDDPLLRVRGTNELPYLESVTAGHARVAVVPWVAVPPVGKGLEVLVKTIDKEAAMSKYVYYCAECEISFEKEVEHPEEGVPVTATCPTCGNKDAKKAFAVEATKPSGGCCSPGGGDCCC